MPPPTYLIAFNGDGNPIWLNVTDIPYYTVIDGPDWANVPRLFSFSVTDYSVRLYTMMPWVHVATGTTTPAVMATFSAD